MFRHAFYHGGNKALWPHTPVMLKQFVLEAEQELITQKEPLLDLLLDPSNYKKSTDPQEIVERFRPYTHEYAIRILKSIHRIRFGHHNDITGRIEPHQLWEGKTIDDVQHAHYNAEVEADLRYQQLEEKRLTGLANFSKLIKRYGTHPATLTKKLKRNNSPVKLITARERYSQYAAIDLGNNFIFSGKSRLLEDVIYEALDELNRST